MMTKIDTLTGNSQQAHRTNVVFFQRQSIEHKPTVENISHSGKKAEISKKLKEKEGELTKVTQYIVSRGTSSEPLVRRYTASPIDGSLTQKKRSVIHALARVDSNGDRPDVDQQQFPAYSGMQACLNQAGERSKSVLPVNISRAHIKVCDKRYHGQKRRRYEAEKHSIFVYGWRLTNICTYC